MMNHKRIRTRTIGLSSFLLFIAVSCAVPQPAPTPIPTTTPVFATASPIPGTADIVITFDGSKCAYNGPQAIQAGKITAEWVIENKDYEKYGLVLATLDKGKTFDDLNQWPSTDPPPWLTVINVWEALAGSRQQLTAQITQGPFYFVCFYSPPDTKFGVLGPLVVEQAEPTPVNLPTITPHAAPTVTVDPKPVVINTDMGADDWMAILYLLQRTDIFIKAITIAGTGMGHCAPGVQHALGLVALAGHDPIPVACGRETPLNGNHAFPDSWHIAADTFMNTGLTLPEEENPASGKTAADLLTSTIQSSPKKVTLLSLGPLTTLAELLESNPAGVKNIEMIYAMGGAVRVPGNVSVGLIDNQVAEFNIYIDPGAANIVFKSGVPITLIPLDATSQAKITNDFYRKLQAGHLTPEATWVYELFTRERGYFQAQDYFWDQLAAAVLTDESLVTFENDTLCVVEDEGPQSGQTKIQAGCPIIRVAESVNTTRFEQVFLDTLNNPQ